MARNRKNNSQQGGGPTGPFRYDSRTILPPDVEDAFRNLSKASANALTDRANADSAEAILRIKNASRTEMLEALRHTQQMSKDEAIELQCTLDIEPSGVTYDIDGTAWVCWTPRIFDRHNRPINGLLHIVATAESDDRTACIIETPDDLGGWLVHQDRYFHIAVSNKPQTWRVGNASKESIKFDIFVHGRPTKLDDSISIPPAKNQVVPVPRRMGLLEKIRLGINLGRS